MPSRSYLALVLLFLAVAPAVAEPVIGFAYTYESPSVQAGMIIMNEAAADTNFSRQSWGPDVLAIRDQQRRAQTDSLKVPVMLISVMVHSSPASQDTLVFPGDIEIGIVHDGRFISAIKAPRDVEVAPGRYVIFFLVFRWYPMIEGDTLAMRPKET